MIPSSPVERDLVLIGGGHAHVAVIKGLAMHPIAGMRLTVISRDALTPYSGMLPGFLAGHYTYEECHIDLRRLCRFANARFYGAAVTGIDPEARLIICEGRPPVSFDLLSIDIGSTPSQFGIYGAASHALPVKPWNDFLLHLARIETFIRQTKGAVRILIVGGGAGGTELCLSLNHRLKTSMAASGDNPDRLQFSLISNTAVLLPNHAPGVSRRMQKAAAQAGIHLHLMGRVTDINETGVTLSDGAHLPGDAVILTTHASAPPWLAQTGLKLDVRGFIQVRDTLESVSHPAIFAAGDIAAMTSRRLEKSGVYAVRQGPVLLKNLRLAAAQKTRTRFHPQRKALALISTGGLNAIASYGPFACEGAWAWRHKDRIDRAWMKKYQQLPESPALIMAQANDADPMLCGGCGAKLDADILHETLASLKQTDPAHVRIGLDRPDDAAVLAPPEGRLLVQSVDQLRSFLDDPYLFGRITANHCLNDIYAMGAIPHSALAMVTLPAGPEKKLRQELQHLMQGVLETLAAANTSLIGGHTALGMEMMLGLTLNGFVDEASIWRKGGAAVGQALILTKPLGSGVLLAADQRARAHAEWIKSATAMMLQSNAAAMDCLSVYGATACTDVSGFGLAGHLREMLHAADLGATLDLGSLPILPGAAEMLASGISSSIQPANQRNAGKALQDDDPLRAHPHYGLLFDPQTSGGLLACVPLDKADDCVIALHALGYGQAAHIGETRRPEQSASLISLRLAEMPG